MVDTPCWGTTANTKTLTGVTVDDDTLAQASRQIELVTGAVYEFTKTLLNKLDAYWIAAAVGYQAAWLADQPDAYVRLDVENASQDGESANFKPDALVLAPLARRALKRLSWRGTRSLVPVKVGEGSTSPLVLPAGAPVHDYEDENWTPLSS